MLTITPITDLDDAFARNDRLIHAWWQQYAAMAQGKLALSLGYQ